MADSRPTPRVSDRLAGGAPDRTGTTGFAGLGVPAALVDSLASAGIREPFPIQAATLPDALAGRDVLGRGRTGSGKTLAFVLPIIARLSRAGRPAPGRRPRALILAPTRELASQILDVINPLASAAGLAATTVFGGVPNRPQIAALRRGVDIVVACPGRLEDLLRSGACRLGSVEITVLDEADHMADLGFLPAVRRILDQTPAGGQRMLFSATLDEAVNVLVKRYLSDPVEHSVDDDRSPVPEMAHHVLHVSAAGRLAALVELTSGPGRKVMFTRTKHRAKTLARQLAAAGVPAVEMHSNLSQSARVRNLNAFTSGRATVLVATDIAARGLHVDDVQLVIHADPPLEHKTYLHRSGRTARAGAGGTVVTLATEDQRADVAKLGRRAGVTPVITQHRPGQRTLDHLILEGAPSPAPASPASSGDERPPAASSARTKRPSSRRRSRSHGTADTRRERGRQDMVPESK
ncbi:MAG TPA: DEAD/DEAH box helicase [Acidimicrobiales bacterium]|nr:DEAD/DEAH box helicase [Acidimicrobiales bacterium]